MGAPQPAPAEVLSAAHAPGGRGRRTQAWGLRSDTLLQPSWSGISVKPSSQSGRAEDGLKHLLFSTQAAGATWRHPLDTGRRERPAWVGAGQAGQRWRWVGLGRGLARCWSTGRLVTAPASLRTDRAMGRACGRSTAPRGRSLFRRPAGTAGSGAQAGQVGGWQVCGPRVGCGPVPCSALSTA